MRLQPYFQPGHSHTVSIKSNVCFVIQKFFAARLQRMLIMGAAASPIDRQPAGRCYATSSCNKPAIQETGFAGTFQSTNQFVEHRIGIIRFTHCSASLLNLSRHQISPPTSSPLTNRGAAVTSPWIRPSSYASFSLSFHISKKSNQ